MRLVHTIIEAREEIGRFRSEKKSIGFVPTMGALHDGHMALVRRARNECGFVAVSIFVNPTQFGRSEDLNKYPRSLEPDADKCREAGVDLVFAPSADEMYPDDFDSWLEVKGLTEILEGESRPGHYRGVTTICAKLFDIIQPDRVYMGMKDYQQCKIIQKMTRDLNMPPDVVPVETVREPDGLAMSSRNAYLNPSERKASLVLSRALETAREAFHSGERAPHVIQELTENFIKTEHMAKIDYVAVMDAETLRPVDVIESPAIVLLAVWIGSTRLIDNCVLDKSSHWCLS